MTATKILCYGKISVISVVLVTCIILNLFAVTKLGAVHQITNYKSKLDVHLKCTFSC